MSYMELYVITITIKQVHLQLQKVNVYIFINNVFHQIIMLHLIASAVKLVFFAK